MRRAGRTRSGSGAARRGVALAFVVLAACLAGARADAQTNVVIFLTDDQRFDTLWAMPLVQQELVARGVTFEQAFVTTPMCCPSRASFLSGGWLSRETGVVDNALPNGGFDRFHDGGSLAQSLQAAGFATGLVGKYLNGYEPAGLYVPPGWTYWYAALGIALDPIQYSLGSSTQLPGVATITPTIQQYGTDHLRDRALDFIDQHANEPFFLYLAFGAPHEPATPAAQDAASFGTYLYRGRAYAEPDLSDKPYRVQLAASQFPAIAPGADAFHRDQLRTLQPVDRAVKAVVDRLVAHGLLDRTLVVFTSDNGYLWGEHDLIGKGEAYEESMRVPLVVVAPGVAPRSDARLVAENLDLAATVRDVAGLPPDGDGMSLLPLLHDPGLPGRSETLIEQSQPWRIWSGIRVRDAGGDWKYVEDSAGDAELYDLAADPYEERNVASDPAHAAVRVDLAARLAPKKGLAITSTWAPPYAIGAPYAFAIQSWGVRGAPNWSVSQGALPPGLALDPATGVVAGVATQVTPSAVTLRLADSALSPQTGLPYRHEASFVFGPPACSDGVDDDGDGKIDFPNDPGCASANDASELDASKPCDDGVDNDGDGKVDTADPGCSIAPYDSEARRRSCGLGAELAGVLLLLRRALSPSSSGASPTRRAA